MESKMQALCKILGVEVGEEFKIFDGRLSDTKYKITIEDGLIHEAANGIWTRSVCLNALLTGRAAIHKLPYHPKFSDEYWTYVDSTWFPSKFEWKGSPIDYAFLGSGVVFRSYEEAIIARPTVYKKLTGREWKER